MKQKSLRNWSSAAVVAAAIAVTTMGAAWVKADGSAKRPMANLSPSQIEAIESANSLSSAFRTVANELLPSVVAIENRPAVAWNTKSHAMPSADGFVENPFKGTPFEDMFKGYKFQQPPDLQKPLRPGENHRSPRPSPRGGIGSGVIIDAKGIILTNNHVVAGGGEVTVRTQDGSEYVATNVWTDPKTDLAVVQIETTDDLVAAALGDSDDVSIGDWVIALGQPFGLESTVTAGIISAKHRGIGITARENFLQTDAAINPGNSGGPLVNLRGEVVGINTAIQSRSGGNEGIGFAIPSNLARWVGDQLVSSGTVKRAYLGVGIQPVSQELARQLAVKPRGGVVVTEVYPDTPADAAGLKPGDVIVRFGSTTTATPQSLQLAVERSPIGDPLVIHVVRDGKPIELEYVAAEQPTDFAVKVDDKPAATGKRMQGLGLEISPLDSDVADQLGMANVEGVVVTSVRDDSSAAEAGIAPGMVIVQVNREPVTTVDEFESALKKSKDSDRGTLLLVKSDSGTKFVVVK